MTIFRFSAAVLLAGTAQADPVITPSGQSITLYDVVLEPGIARFRYVAPAIDPSGQGLTHPEVFGDFIWLCENFAIPGLVAAEKSAEQVIITLSDREVEFGATAPDATQFIESYTVRGPNCIWDEF